MKKTSLRLILCLLLACMIALAGCSGEQKKPKPSPDEVLQTLKDGNERFLNGKSEHPHLDKKRMMQASLEDQGDHAYATILASSDSRVPVEAIFDAGIMDIFAIRVPGNVCNADQVSAIEYGLNQVRTPVVVVLGNTQCPAVTAVTRAMNEHGQDLEKNIPPMLAGIEPAVKKTMEKYPQAKGDQIIPLAIEENIYISIRDLFMKSPATCDLVKAGKVKVVGAIYDVSDGRVYWLEDATVDSILQEVEAMADGTGETAIESHDEATQAHEALPESTDAETKAHEAETQADEVTTDSHEAATEDHKAVSESHDEATQTHDAAAQAEEVAPESHEAAPEALAPSETEGTHEAEATHEAEETHAEPEPHDSESHQ